MTPKDTAPKFGGREFPLQWVRGHLLFEPIVGSDLKALVDTGAPYTTSHRNGDNYLGHTLRDIEEMAGFRIDYLVGMDAFLPGSVLLTSEYIEFGAARIDGVEQMLGAGNTIHIPATLVSGNEAAPGVTFFDSGASLSYIDEKHAGPIVGKTEDYFPPVGRYEATQHAAELQIADITVPFVGIVPDIAVHVTGGARHSLIGSELLRWVDLWIDMPTRRIVVRRKQEGNQWEPMSPSSWSASLQITSEQLDESLHKFTSQQDRERNSPSSPESTGKEAAFLESLSW